MSNLEYIRKTFNVPAFEGQQVRYVYDKGCNGEQLKKSREGVIVEGTPCANLKIKYNGDSFVYPAFTHPTWNLEYL